MTVHENVEQIYEAERENIYSYLLYFGVLPQRAQELAQDAFLKLYLKMEQGDVIENPRAWLYKVAHNLALRAHEREPRFDELTPALPGPPLTLDIERSLIEKARRTALIRAIRDLSPQQRNCFHLRVQGLRLKDIAAVVGISTSAVAEFLRRATVKLKEAVDE